MVTNQFNVQPIGYNINQVRIGYNIIFSYKLLRVHKVKIIYSNQILSG